MGKRKAIRAIPRRMRLLTKCCQSKAYFAMGVGHEDGIPHCGGCGRWIPELQIVPAHGVGHTLGEMRGEAAE